MSQSVNRGMHGTALMAQHFYDQTQGATPGRRSTPRSSRGGELRVLRVLTARLTPEMMPQPAAIRALAPPAIICQSVEGTPGWSLGSVDQAQVHHHISKPAKTRSLLKPEGLVRRAHAPHRWPPSRVSVSAWAWSIKPTEHTAGCCRTRTPEANGVWQLCHLWCACS